MYRVQFPDVSQRHLGRAIALQAEHNGDTTFLMFGERRYTFSETNQRVNELAAGLSARGIGRNDRVVFYMGSSPEIYFLVLAVNKLGAVWIPINTDYKGAWLEDSIQRSKPKLLVTDEHYAPRIAEIAGSLELDSIAVLAGDEQASDQQLEGAIDFDSLYVEGAGEPDMSDLNYGDVSSVLWTSGTTGRSKGVMQSHNVWFNAGLGSDDLHTTQKGDVIYNVLPMYNSGAWVTALFRALFAGVSLAVDPHFSASNFWERIKYYQATQIFMIGTMHIFVWNQPERDDDADNTLREVQAVPMPADLIEPFSKRFGVRVLGQGFSQSEAMMIVRQDPRTRDGWPLGSCGTVVDNVDVTLRDDDCKEVATGEPGELWVRPHEPHIILEGYFEDPEATANAFEGEWYKTGDLLKCDADGNYFFVDRKKDAVRYKGRNISTFEVELVARKHPAIADCAAFGIAAEELSVESELKLNVVLKPDQAVQAEELAQYINDNAPYFFVPRYIEFVDALPYTPNNKVQKYKLRDAGLSEATWDANKAGFKAQR